MTIHIALVPIDGEYTEDGDVRVPEAGGAACFNKILEACETYGVVLFTPDGKTSIFETMNFPGWEKKNLLGL